MKSKKLILEEIESMKVQIHGLKKSISLDTIEDSFRNLDKIEILNAKINILEWAVTK